MMSLARRSFRRRSMNMETMKMVVRCPRLNRYPLLRLRWWTDPLLHLRRQIKNEEKLMLRVSYGPPWAHYLGGYQDRLFGGPWDYPACAARHLMA
jgi:hypothetical protein